MLLSLLVSAAAEAAEDRMTFEIVPGHHGPMMFAAGRIDEYAAERFEGVVRKRRPPPGLTVYFDSIGGSPYQAMKLGRAIRRLDLNTAVGKASNDPSGSYAARGGCYSSCAYAFLGGKSRSVGMLSEIGVHRFTTPGKVPVQAIAVGQMLSADLVAYMLEMGVDPELFVIAARTPNGRIYTLTLAELERLRVARRDIESPVRPNPAPLVTLRSLARVPPSPERR